MPCHVNDRDKNNPEEKGRLLFNIKIENMCNGLHKISTSQRTDYINVLKEDWNLTNRNIFLYIRNVLKDCVIINNYNCNVINKNNVWYIQQS